MRCGVVGSEYGGFVFFFFFFQAEDGIRDTSVTGVQTCALPISVDEDEADAVARQPFEHARGGGEVRRLEADAGRSEERRVGKECRSRWARGRLKEKTNAETSLASRINRSHGIVSIEIARAPCAP